MRRVIDPLTAAGARFTARDGGRLPLAIEGAREALPLDYRVPVPSAQVKSAVLLAGLNAPGITRVEEPEATRDHSENMLRHFGANVRVEVAGPGVSSNCRASRSCMRRMSSCRAIRRRPRSRWWRRCWLPAARSPSRASASIRCALGFCRPWLRWPPMSW